ncbi:MAG: hypothetical protein RL033_6717 [Pseudomonadota bacterium]|jgi:hypothetical protein
MSLRPLPVSLAAFGLALLAFAPSANAHIRLVSPAPRYAITGTDTGIKSCPCGLGQSNRTCNLATDASDSDGRSENVLRVEAGSQLMLSFVEYVDHSGSFRVAFDPDGADVADFNKNILVPFVMDPPNTGNQTWNIPVTVPNTTCDNCTIQLIQAMNGDTTNPVADPTAISTYYTCVDVEIVAPGTLGDDDEDPVGAAGGSSMPGAAGSSSVGTGAAGSGSTGVGGSSAAGGMTAGGTNTSPLPLPMMGDNTGGTTTPAGGMNTGTPTTAVGSLTPGMGSTSAPGAMSASESDSDSGGCALGMAGSSSRWAAALSLAGALTLLARRRRNRAA